jgi:hypothetical protein
MNLLLKQLEEGDEIAQENENIAVFIHSNDDVLADSYSALYD